MGDTVAENKNKSGWYRNNSRTVSRRTSNLIDPVGEFKEYI